MEIRVLGPVDVREKGRSLPLGGPKQRALLALLVAGLPRVVETDRLVEGLWGEEASAGSRSTLQTYVSNLRQVLGDVLVHVRNGYRLEVDPGLVDSVQFTRGLEESRLRMATAPDTVATELRRVLAMWRGRPYADLMDVPGLEPEIRRLEFLRLEAVELRIEAELVSGHHFELLAELEGLAEEYPTRERFRGQQMLALYRAGRQADALRAYRRTERYLAEELGVNPSQELQDLELKILEHDDSLLVGGGRAVTQRLAFLVTDIEGSTRLWDRFPAAMASALATHDKVLGEEIQKAGGRVFKHTGDGVLAAFPDAVAAVAAAEAVLFRLMETDWGEVGELLVRMGIDVGEAEARGDDFFGPPLNRATRLCAIAHGSQILVSSPAEREITASAPAGLQVRHLGEVHLRGMAAPERVAQIVFVGLPADFPDLRVDVGSTLDRTVGTMSLPGYEVRDRIGEGAFGVVFRAYQPSVGREVAVKVIRPDLACQPSFVRRFEAEARMIARLAHPHIAPLIDFWRDTTCAYLVLGLLPGGSLAEELRRRTVERASARQMLAQIGSALDHAHSHGVVHGDLKPANVLLDGSGNAYLSDFGLAARLLDPEVMSDSSSAPEYRAPEESVTGPSPAADRYAFGVLAANLLSDNDELEPILSRATARLPDDRYPSTGALLADVNSVLGVDSGVEENPPVTRNPYKGLRSFDEADAADFHGREDLVSALMTALSRHRFVTVVGPSGSGKSSVVRSGLIPALLSGRGESSKTWVPVVVTPGSAPIESLGKALAKVTGGEPGALTGTSADLVGWAEAALPDGDLLLVIDQFEEVYTLVDDPGLRNRFFDLLVEAVTRPGPVHVVATLRADFYDRPLADSRMGKLVRDGQVTVLPASRDELVEMIAGPAQAVGLRWEPGLPHRIAEDVAHQPGGLPLLQYALTELVERRGGDLLTGSDYRRIGEVAGALANRAEAVYQGLSPSQQDVARLVLTRLVTVDEESDDTRRRVRRSELESLEIPHGDLNAVLDLFTAERLLLADRDPVAHTPTVEVAHEALLREWPRLRRWIDEQREALIIGRRFRAALVEWEANHRHDDYLLTGSRLSPFLGWSETSTMTPEEAAFYAASRRKDDEARAARRRRRRTLTGILGTAALLAILLGAVAVVQANRATSQAEVARAAEQRAEEEAEAAVEAAGRAETEAQTARARELSAFATAALEFDPVLSKLLGVSAARTARPTIDGISLLHQAFAADPVVGRYSWPDEREVGFMWTALSPDGSRLVAAGCGCATPSTYLEVFDLDNDEVLWSFDDVEDTKIIVDSPIFSPDGDTVVAGLYWLGETEATAGPLGAHIWDADTGELVQHLDLGRCGGTVYGFSDTHIVTDSVMTDAGGCFYQGMAPPGILLIERHTSARRVLTPNGAHLVMSRDGRYVAYGDRSVEPHLTVVEDVFSGERVLELPVEVDEHVRALSPDGSLLVLSVEDRLETWDVLSGERLSSFFGHPAGVWSVTFSAGGDETVYSTGRTGALFHWEPRTGKQIASFPAVGNGNVSTADNGLVVVADQVARTASLIDTHPRGEVWVTEANTCGGFVLAGTLAVGGEHAAFGVECPLEEGATRAVVVDVEDGEVVSVVEGGKWQTVGISPDGSRIARVDAGEGPNERRNEEWFGPARIRGALTGDVLVELEGICTWDYVSAVGKGGDGTEQPGCAAYPETPFPMLAGILAWSPDGKRIAMANPMTRLLAVWDASSGELISGYNGCAKPSGGFFDGEEIIVYCAEDEQPRMIVVDATTGDEVRSVAITRLASDNLAFTGYTPDGSSLVGLGGMFGVGSGSLLWFDPETFAAEELPRIHEGSPKSFATSPSGVLVATGSSDGFVKVWDVVERRQVHEIQVGNTEVQGLAFVDEDHLLVLTQSGMLSLYTLQVDDLVDVVARSITREFTDTECARYGFGDVCPTLDELRQSEFSLSDRAP